ncbi:Phosphatidylethanolamine-binding protein PEBP [Niveomyces insectorum RCEF 264]|uniref:Phosphatidylethanolamine-binding protein PEBP n=1 Tax=Niveomyces insectorum RCEF 264 TaxID=1081102 RepID=A0A167Y161_9HYPO|nr:Phosphatidylethanolamine-binding protein PEBP [Niveomyces insectorum RCEF 264]
MASRQVHTAKQPTIALSTANASSTYLFIMMDLDVPAGGARSTLLHAMLQDFKASGSGGVLTSTATGPASYMGPAPPKETPAHPHHYVQVLFEQPAGFAVPATMQSAVRSRLGFNLANFVTAASLGAPVAGNYFTVTG